MRLYIVVMAIRSPCACVVPVPRSGPRSPYTSAQTEGFNLSAYDSLREPRIDIEFDSRADCPPHIGIGNPIATG